MSATLDLKATRRPPRRASLASHRHAKGIASVIVVLALIELAGRVGLLSQVKFPLVSEVLRRLGSEATTSEFWVAVAQTLGQAAAGLLIGTALAVPIGLVFGRIPFLDAAFRPLIEFLRPIPSIAILPLVILTMGVTARGAILLTSVSTFWLVLVLTIRGARAVDPVAEQAMAVFGLPARARLLHLLLPSASPFIVTGVRIATSVSLIVAISTELLGGISGLGALVANSLQAADTTGIYAYTFAAGVLGTIVNAVVKRGEDALLWWHPSRRPRG